MLALILLIPWVLTVIALLIIMIMKGRWQEVEDDDDFISDEVETVRVAVYDEKAYWVYDNVFYESDTIREPDFTTARPIDTMELPPKELNMLMKILDDLKNNERE